MSTYRSTYTSLYSPALAHATSDNRDEVGKQALRDLDYRGGVECGLQTVPGPGGRLRVHEGRRLVASGGA